METTSLTPEMIAAIFGEVDEDFSMSIEPLSVEEAEAILSDGE